MSAGPQDSVVRSSPVGPGAVGGAVALVLGASQLGHDSLWADEGISAAAIARGWGELAQYVVAERPTHGAYYAVLKLWAGAGSGEFAMRSLSVVCFVAAAALTAVLATRLFGRGAGWAAGVLFAVNPFLVEYAQEARVYALVLALTVVCTLLFVHAMEVPSTRRWLAYALSAVAIVYLHAVAGTVLAAHAIAFLVKPQRPWRPALLALGVATLALAPLALAVTRSGTGSISWIVPPQPEFAYPVLRELAGGADLLVAMLAVAIAIGVWATRRSWGSGAGWGLALSGLLVVTPFVLTYGASLLVPMFLPRYLIVAVPGIVLLAAAGIASLPRAWMTTTAVALVVAACAPALWARYTSPQNEDWRGAAAVVASQDAVGDVVVVDPVWGRPAFEHYHGGQALGAKALRRGRVGNPRRLWLVTVSRYADPGTEDAARSFARRHRERRRWRGHEILVRLYSRP